MEPWLQCWNNFSLVIYMISSQCLDFMRTPARVVWQVLQGLQASFFSPATYCFVHLVLRKIPMIFFFFFFLPMILLNKSICQNRKVWWLPWHLPSLLPSLLSPPVQGPERCGNMSHPLHLHPSTSVVDSGQGPAVLLITCKTHRFQTSQESITQE